MPPPFHAQPAFTRGRPSVFGLKGLPALGAPALGLPVLCAFALCAFALGAPACRAGEFANPVMPGADPHALAHGKTVWVYPTRADPEGGAFYAYSSDDLKHWTRHGPVLRCRDVPWLKADGRPRHGAWAPGVIARGGKWYFYYAVGPQTKTHPSRIGVAVGDSPAGPFRDSGRPLLTGGNGFEAIDPMVFADPATGKYYLYAGGSAGAKLRMFELAPDMAELAAEIPVKTPPRFTEGAFMHFRDGLYYLSYSHGKYKTSSYSVHYATAPSPSGPWTYRGAILTGDALHKGPGHHSFFINPSDGAELIAYHRYDGESGDGPYKSRRKIAFERVDYNADGTIRPIVMTDAGKTPAPSAWRWRRQDGTPRLLAPDNSPAGHLAETAPDGVAVSGRIETLDGATFKIVRHFTARRDIPDARLTLAFVHHSPAAWWMIPAVSYNGNHYGRGKEPKGAARDGRFRTLSFRRTPLPGAVYSEGGRFAVATWGDAPKTGRESFSCSIEPEARHTAHRMIWPEEETPFVYCARDKYTTGSIKPAALKKGESITLTLYLNIAGIEPDHAAIRHFLRQSWRLADKPRAAGIYSPEKLWRLGIRYATGPLWAEEGVFKGFSIGLRAAGDGGWEQRQKGKYEIGWCGQNASLANSLLVDYIKNKNEDSKNKALAALDTWAAHCPLPGGLFITHFDRVLDQRENYTMDACNLGVAAMNFFEAADLARAAGAERPNYERIAFDLCEFVRADQQPSGAYARGWRRDGAPVVREGGIGCFMTPPMLEAWRRSKNPAWLESAKKSFSYYMGELKTRGYTTAGALDTWCIDKESALPLLRSALMLHEITGRRAYLDDAVAISYYLSTWLWHYEGVYPPDDDFTKHHYSTFGATSVSVQHNHLDPYALYWVPEWVKLSELTGDPQWLEKAAAIWRNGNQLVSDGTLEIHGRIRPAGSQNEAYFECDWGFGSSGGVSERINQWLVAWPGAFRLETLRKLGDRAALLYNDDGGRK